jgi:hypothetical protein
MFAAAAVAAAAALTAISATSTNTTSKQVKPSINVSQNQDPLFKQNTYISWAQYAHERRNSLQRRKIEISKRLENASKANKSPRKDIKIDQFQSKDLQQKNKLCLEAPKNLSTDKLNPHLMARLDAINMNRLNSKGPLNDKATNIIDYLSLIDKNLEDSNDNCWLTDLKARVCNEFIKSHKLYQNKETEIDFLNNIDLSNSPTYKNFQLLMNSNELDSNGKQIIDINQISEALLEYLEMDSMMISLNNIENFNNATLKTEKGNIMRCNDTNQHKNDIQKINKKKEEKLNFLFTHRWDPDWLRSSRNGLCIPFALVSLICLIFTTFSTNWICFQGKIYN